MSRPIYERPEDRARERAAMARLEAHLRVTIAPTPKEIELVEAPRLHPFDYEVMVDGRLWGLVEVKCRNNRQGDYPNYMISERKVRVLREAAHARGVTPILLVSWADKTGYADATRLIERGIRAWGGRSDRNDPADQEAVIHAPLSVFTEVK